ncbi:MAG: hypothetical protein Q4E33_01755 [Erysipelotrichaceae bacterium]|nr:hypothetical protein [Erysipelotrichaceae bacterium]
MMILKFNKSLITDSHRIDIFNEENILFCWTQNDFSYKNRKYLYDSLDNKVMYAQLNIKHDHVDIYDSNDKLFGSINLTGNEFVTSFIDWRILADENYRIVDSGGKEIMNVKEENDCYVLNIHENENDLNCAICLISIADYLKNERC